MDLTRILEFFKYQNGLKAVLRNNGMPDGRRESSAEHSWSVAMMAWLLTDRIQAEKGVTLDQNKMLKMALVHDIVEIQAGDVAAWKSGDRQAVAPDERAAIEHIAATYFGGNQSEIYALWMEHEERQTLESKVVKACDQLCPLVYRVVFGASYHGTGVTREKLDDIFRDVVSFSSVTSELYELLAAEIAAKGLFDNQQ